MNSAATGSGCGPAGEHLLNAVADQRPVRQPGQRVVGGQERELLLAAGELGVGALALGVEALGHPHKGELEAQLQRSSAPARRLGRDLQLRGALCSTWPSRPATTGSVSSPGSATRHDAPRARRRCARFPGRPRSPPRSLSGDPAGHRHRRAPVDAFEAILDDRHRRPRRGRAPASVSSRTSLVAPSAPRRGADVLPEIGHGRRRRRQGRRRRRTAPAALGCRFAAINISSALRADHSSSCRLRATAPPRLAGIPWTGSATGGDRFSAS